MESLLDIMERKEKESIEGKRSPYHSLSILIF